MNPSTDYLKLITGLLGEGPRRFADERAWRSLEEQLGFALPKDYKQIVDAYAPFRINETFSSVIPRLTHGT